MRKKLIRVLIIILVAVFVQGFFTAKANDDINDENELTDKISEIIGDVDFSELEKYINECSAIICKGGSVKSILVSLASGKGIDGYENIYKDLLTITFNGISDKIPVFISIFVLLVICTVFNGAASDKVGGVGEIIKFVVYSTAVSVIATIAVSIIGSAKTACERVVKIIQATFPLILAFLTASGGAAQVATYSPSALFIQNFTSVFICKTIFPVISTMLALSIVSNLSKTVKLQGLIDFLSGFIKWTIGLIGSLFTILSAIKGANAGAFDGVGLRALKYAVGTSVPIIGGVASGSADFVISAIILTKNALGAFTAVILFGAILTPVCDIVVMNLSLKLLGAITEPFGDGEIYKFIKSCVGVINHALAAIVIASLMLIITILLVITSSVI